MRTPKRCLKYDSTRNFYYQIYNIIMPDRKKLIQQNKYIYKRDEVDKFRNLQCL